MTPLLTGTDDLLRGRAAGARLPFLLLLVAVFGLFYGAVMGTWSGAGSSGVRVQQVLYSGLKVPLLLLVTFVLSLPSFFVLNTVLGVRNDFGEVLRALEIGRASCRERV